MQTTHTLVRAGTAVSAAVILCLSITYVAPARGQCVPQATGQFSPTDMLSCRDFGSALALDGNTLLVGAAQDQIRGNDRAGAAYVFVHTWNGWSQQTKLISPNPMANAYFGYSVALDGDVAVIGAPMENHEVGQFTGAAYVFTRADGVWTLQAQLRASNESPNSQFGQSVAVSGNTILVGAPYGDSSMGMSTGAVHVFERSGDEWIETSILAPADAATLDRFGYAIAFDNQTAVIGAPRIRQADAVIGSAFVFVHANQVWQEQAELRAPDPQNGEFFGATLALDGDTALIGTSSSMPPTTTNGAAYFFIRSNGDWRSQGDPIVPAGVGFEFATALHHDVALLGVGHQNAVYIATRSNGVWVQTELPLEGDPVHQHGFGRALALDGNFAVIGTSSADVLAMRDVGAAFVYSLDCMALPSDLDGDGDVDLDDLAQLLGHYGIPFGASHEEGDVDGDGDVDLGDLAELLGHYGQ